MDAEDLTPANPDALTPAKETKDVYGGPAKLKEGLRRQTILIYVADETGMINRVAGVFARRGYNIESLAVGLNIDKAIFTVVVIASDGDCAKLIKQINKLAKVSKVGTSRTRCRRRGLMLMKVEAKPEQRAELAELAKIFERPSWTSPRRRSRCPPSAIRARTVRFSRRA